MEYKDFVMADEKDVEQYIVRPERDIPETELVKGSYSRLLSTRNVTVSFLTMKANSVFEIHTHENEQCMVVVRGFCDEIIDGKIYRVSAGDVIYLPAGIPHGAFILEEDCIAIDIFSPVRSDYMAKYIQQNPGGKIIFQ